MRLLEELSMNALPSLQTTLYDGWILRLADGFTNRANSINPIYPSIKNINTKIEKCETVFKSKNLRPTYKITPFVYPENLDRELENRGYKSIHHTSVQTMDLSNLMEPSIHTVTTSSVFDEKWFEYYCSMNKINTDNRITCKKIFNNILPFKFFVSLYMDDSVIACGMAVIEEGFIGLFNITVDEKYRNQGYGMQLLANMLKIGKFYGAKSAYLQVMLDNLPALHLYEKLGFKESYQYHYRVLSG